MATGGSSEEVREKNTANRRSWSDVVSSSPTRSSSPPANTNQGSRVMAGMPNQYPVRRQKFAEDPSPGRGSSPQKIFSAEDVAKLVELARRQLRREQENISGWKEVDSNAYRNKEKSYARDLVEGFHGSPEMVFKCWQCDLPGHKSSECPNGERCFVCNSQDHKRADCPVKKKATRKEKGKALDLGNAVPHRRQKPGGIIIDEYRTKPGKTEVLQTCSFNNKGSADLEEQQPQRKEWRPVLEARAKSVQRPGRQQEAGEAKLSHRPGRQGEKQQEASKFRGTKVGDSDNRHQRSKPVYLIRSEGAAAERQALLSTGGVVSRVNGNPSIKDYVDALKKMTATYANWEWKPIPVTNGILFRFPSEGGLTVLAKRDVIPCNNGHFVVSRWKEEKEGFNHSFPFKAVVLAFNVPPYLRTEADLARMVAGFAHLIESSQIIEEGGPMKLTLGCHRRADIPKELPIIFGGKEFRIALAIREVLGIKRQEEEKGEMAGDGRTEARLGRGEDERERMKTNYTNLGEKKERKRWKYHRGRWRRCRQRRPTAGEGTCQIRANISSQVES